VKKLRTDSAQGGLGVSASEARIRLRSNLGSRGSFVTFLPGEEKLDQILAAKKVETKSRKRKVRTVIFRRRKRMNKVIDEPFRR